MHGAYLLEQIEADKDQANASSRNAHGDRLDGAGIAGKVVAIFGKLAMRDFVQDGAEAFIKVAGAVGHDFACLLSAWLLVAHGPKGARRERNGGRPGKVGVSNLFQVGGFRETEP